MEAAVYQQNLDAIHTIGLLSRTVDAQGVIDAINRAESIAPFTDPTLMQKYLGEGGVETNRAIGTICRAILNIQTALKELEGGRGGNET